MLSYSKAISPLTRLMEARWLCLLLLFCLLPLAGCGGGGGAKSKTTARKGAAILTIIWPQPAAGRHSRLIPQDTLSIVVTLQFLDKNVPTPIGDTLIQRPDAGFSNKTETKLDNLPIGNLLVSAKAYATKTPTASDVALAVSLEFPLVVTDGIPTPVPVELNGTVDTIDIQPQDGQFDLNKSQLTSGQTLILKGFPKNKAGAYVSITSTLQWSVTDRPDVLTVDPKSGLVTAQKPGRAMVQVLETETGKSNSVPLTVRNGSVTDIAIDGAVSRRINVNESLDLTAIVTDDQGNKINVTGLQWLPDDPTIVDASRDTRTSNTHTIMGLKPGVTRLLVHDQKSVRDSSKITITVGTGALQNLSIKTSLPDASSDLTAGGTGLTLVATGTDDAGLPYNLTPANANLTWMSNSGAATVVKDPDTGYGKVTPVQKGDNALITVTEVASGKQARFKVSVKLSVQPITVDNDHPTLHRTANCSTSIIGAISSEPSGVMWSVVNADGKDISGDNAGGTIVDKGTDAMGNFIAQYTAPTRAGVYYILATSRDGSNQKSPLRAITVQSGTGTITVR